MAGENEILMNFVRDRFAVIEKGIGDMADETDDRLERMTSQMAALANHRCLSDKAIAFAERGAERKAWMSAWMLAVTSGAVGAVLALVIKTIFTIVTGHP